MFWLEDPKKLLEEDLNFVIPTNLSDRLNFFFKYIIIISLILTILFQDFNFLILILIFGLLTILVYYHNKRKEKYDNEDEIDIVDNKRCTKSTFHNPFMNPSVYDINNNPKKPEACNIEKVDMNAEFYKGVFRTANDLYDKEASVRQFYTMPSTTIPNKQDEFAKWLYDRGPSCKQGNYDRCATNLDLGRTDLDRVGIMSTSKASAG